MLRFGLAYKDIETAVQRIGPILGLEFEKHDSSFRGGDYYRHSLKDGGAVLIQRNLDQLDAEAFVDDWPPDQTLLVFDGLSGTCEQSLSAKLDAMLADKSVKLIGWVLS